jgi:hypothetical protein
MSRSSWIRWPLLACVVLTSAACATLWHKLVPQRDEIKSAHARHKKADVECLGCHEDIFDVEEMGQTVLPSEKKCFECHKKERDAKDCGFCHTDASKPLSYEKRASGVKMSHAKHLEMERVNEDCGVCHKKLSETRPLRRTSTPMATCLDCHEHKAEYNAASCSPCHDDLTRFPLRPLTAYSHQGDYTRNHGRQAESNGQSCAQCHDQSFCSDCHVQTVPLRIEARLPERVDRNFIHWGNYLSRHVTEARAESRATCQKCHGQSFCQDCHRASGLTPEGAPEGVGQFDPHPVGFNTPGSPDFHGPAARRDIGSCAACHDQAGASNCIECHSVGGIGGNPHPASFRSKHDLNEASRNATCRFCHN